MSIYGAHRILWTCASIITCCYAWCPVDWIRLMSCGLNSSCPPFLLHDRYTRHCVLILETFIMTMYEILSLISTGWWDVSYYDYGWDFCDVIDETMDLNIVMWLCVRCFMWKICCAIFLLIYLLCCGMCSKIKINNICNAGQINFLEAYYAVGS